MESLSAKYPSSPAKSISKEFLLFFLPAALVIGLLLALFHYIKTESELTIIKAHEWSHIDNGKKSIAHEFHAATSDLFAIAESPLLHDFIANPEPSQRDKLIQAYLTLSSSKELYDQIRFLDRSGMELIRVDYSKGQPVAVPKKDLQNKGRRYYFTDTFYLAKGEVFVSPFDLNIEQGKIEHPRKPMIRFGMPVFDQNGKKQGIVLLNYQGSVLIQHLKETMIDSARVHAVSSEPAGHLFPTTYVSGAPLLINQDGFWLLGLRAEEEWGFMFGKVHRFAEQFPEAWQPIRAQEEGQIITPAGMFTFTTIYPLLTGHVSATGSPTPFAPSVQRLSHRDYAWKLLSFVSHDQLTALYWDYLQLTGALYAALLLLFLGPLCWYLGRLRIHKRQSEESAQRYQFIVNKSQDLMTLIDPDYRYLAISDSFCAAHGKERQEILGRTVAELWGVDGFRQGIQTHLDRCLSGELVSYSDWLTIPAQGICYFDVTMTPFLDLQRNRFYAVVVSRDISDRKKAEDELLKAKLDWENTFNAVPDLITILDRQFRIIRVNKAMTDGLQLSEEECLGKTCYQLVHGLSEPHANCPHVRLLENGRPHETEICEKRLGGDFLVTVAPLFDQQGTLRGSVHVARDITKSKRSRQRIENLNLLMEELLEAGSLQERLQRITDGVVEIFGADFARIWLIAPGDRCDSGCFHADLANGPDACQNHDRCLHLLASSGRYTHLDGKKHCRVPFGCYKIGRIASEEYPKFICNDVTNDPRVHDHAWAKELGLTSFAGYRLLSQDQKPMGVLALFSKEPISPDEDALLASIADTTAQVVRTSRAEEAIAAAHDRMQAILDNVDAMVYITDIETYEILMINRYVRDRFGAVEGKKCWQAIQTGQTGPCSFCEMQKLTDAEADQPITHVWLVQNTRNKRWYECHDTRITWVDNRLVRLQIATDISERKEAEEKLKEYASVQKTLLREVNHRVKNNLSAIIGMLHMEEERADSKKVENYADALHDVVARIHGLATVHSLLSASEWRPIHLSDLCSEVAHSALHGLPRHQEVELTVHPSPLLIGSHQAHHLALVINELTTNTMKHALRERDMAHIEMHIEGQGKELVTIRYQDDGPGYPKEICAEDYSRANTGLEIVLGIITATLRGTISFSNRPGATTIFSFQCDTANEELERAE